jgi:hypothetical protein
MSSKLVDSTLLFEFAIRIAKFEASPSRPKPKKVARKASSLEAGHWELGEAHRLPYFGSLSGKAMHGEVFFAWSEAGLYLQMRVSGKSAAPSFVQDRGGFSDGLRVWIDTRCSPGIHRATRFCHCFHFFPGQPNPSSDVTESSRPHAILDEIPRCRELPAAIDPNDLEVRSTFYRDGYALWGNIPARCLTGYSPLEFDRIRIFYDIVDRELGTQSMMLGPELRYAEDPSHWVQASLV